MLLILTGAKNALIHLFISSRSQTGASATTIWCTALAVTTELIRTLVWNLKGLDFVVPPIWQTTQLATSRATTKQIIFRIPSLTSHLLGSHILSSPFWESQIRPSNNFKNIEKCVIFVESKKNKLKIVFDLIYGCYVTILNQENYRCWIELECFKIKHSIFKELLDIEDLYFEPFQTYNNENVDLGNATRKWQT
jgi:hypothetical protein